MSAQLQGAQVTLTAAPQNLTTLIRAQDPTFIDQAISSWAMRADSANTGQVRLLKAPLDNATNRCGFLAAGDALAVDIRSMGLHTDGIWLLSSVPGDTVWVFGIVI